MNTRFVETFILLARIGSVRRVAEVMHATPGAISMRLRSLEAELGASLFHYDGKSMALTEHGARLVQHAEALLETTRKMETAARETGAELSGRVRVGVIETVVHTCLPDLMKLMRSSLPAVDLDLQVDLTVNLAEQMMSGKLDIVLRVSSAVHPSHATVEDLMRLPVHWVARRGLLPKRDLLHNVLRQQLLLQMRGTQPYLDAMNLIQQLAGRQGVALSDLRVSAAPSITAQLALAREGVGVALVPGIFVKEQIERGDLVELDLPPLPAFKMSLWHPWNARPLVLKTAEVLRKGTRNFCKRHEERWVVGLS
ncbi:LysR family transcriptional regulator [Xylophilus rhododendri]|uniref:LysR family transcriptional regulator n=1 Tax=Xylophilus rhododendri TaxID=2697032 RepID=A0A857J784_9BURK|nr:LysR family transcriptional regulator [Xylophilus rhododendri]QHI99706.1 LysR family transcriptional regulator [Xylophilus rhododendri]